MYNGVVWNPGDKRVWGWTSNQVTRWTGKHEDLDDAETVGLVSIQAAAVDAQGTFWALGWTADRTPAVVASDGTTWKRTPLPHWREARLWRTAQSTTEGAWFVSDRGEGTEAEAIRVRRTGIEQVPIPAEMVGLFSENLFADHQGNLGSTAKPAFIGALPEPTPPGPNPATSIRRGGSVRGKSIRYLVRMPWIARRKQRRGPTPRRQVDRGARGNVRRHDQRGGRLRAVGRRRGVP